MKAFIQCIAILSAILSACTGNNNEANKPTKKVDPAETSQPANSSVKQALLAEVVSCYLGLKNALASDNSQNAATAGKALSGAIQKINGASLTSEQKKVYDYVKDDIKEHGEHIGNNGDKIAHQREHFDMLSQDMYDLVKALGSGQTLYQDHCPMYNNGKGAIWLSEVKEIKNPYLGKKMPDCGTVKEEIK